MVFLKKRKKNSKKNSKKKLQMMMLFEFVVFLQEHLKKVSSVQNNHQEEKQKNSWEFYPKKWHDEQETKSEAKVTHLVASEDEDGSAKRDAAEEKGVQIVEESFIHSTINRPLVSSEELWSQPILDQEKRPPFPSAAKIAAIEKECGYKLPASLLRLLKIQNGGNFVASKTSYPTYVTTSWSDDSIEITSLLSLGGDDGIGGKNTLGDCEDWSYPKIGLYIIDCPSAGHDVVMLDYSRSGPQGEPRVVHVDTEPPSPLPDDSPRITVLAQNFEDFLRGLTAPKEQ
jgi:hypothetical protein